MHRSAALPLLLATLAGCAPVQPSATEGLVDESPEVPAALRSRPRLVPYTSGPTVLYLNLEGATITKALDSNAYQNLSFLCGATIPPFDHTPYGGDRGQVAGELVAKVAGLFRDFSVQLVIARPSAPPYEMIIIGGDCSLCGYDKQNPIGGLGPLDCDDALQGELAFVFAQTFTQLDGLAVAIAHEAGHSFGLVHTSEPCDVMSNIYCAGKAFLDKTVAVAPDHLGKCGQGPTTNSWQRLRDILGAATRLDGQPPDGRPGDARGPIEARPLVEARPQLEPAAAGSGCSVGGGENFLLPVPVILGLLFCVWRMVAAASRGRERSRGAWHGDPRRTLLGNR